MECSTQSTMDDSGVVSTQALVMGIYLTTQHVGIMVRAGGKHCGWPSPGAKPQSIIRKEEVIK